MPTSCSVPKPWDGSTRFQWGSLHQRNCGSASGYSGHRSGNFGCGFGFCKGTRRRSLILFSSRMQEGTLFRLTGVICIKHTRCFCFLGCRHFCNTRRLLTPGSSCARFWGWRRNSATFSFGLSLSFRSMRRRCSLYLLVLICICFWISFRCRGARHITFRIALGGRLSVGRCACNLCSAKITISGFKL